MVGKTKATIFENSRGYHIVMFLFWEWRWYSNSPLKVRMNLYG